MVGIGLEILGLAELFEQFALLTGELLGRPNVDINEQIALTVAVDGGEVSLRNMQEISATGVTRPVIRE